METVIRYDDYKKPASSTKYAFDGGNFMFCRNCGSQIDNNAAVCIHCGVAVGNGNRFCPNCGAQTMPGAPYCNTCGAGIPVPVPAGAQKSKIAAGLLGIFLGCYGVHNFYLGFTSKAVAQLILTIVGIFTCWLIIGLFMIIAAGIWGLVEGIMILCGSIPADARGIPLKD